MRSEICKGCCPNGGALFDVGMSRADLAAELPIDPQRYVKTCRNCGYEKPWFTRFSAKREARKLQRAATIATLKELCGIDLS